MNFLKESGIRLRTEQALLDDILDAINKASNIDSMRDGMADEIMNMIDSIVETSLGKKAKHAKFHEKVTKYLEKEWVPGDGWKFVKQFINLAVIDTHHYESSVLALPPNKKILEFLLPRIKEEFGIEIKEINKTEAKQIMLEEKDEERGSAYYRENWNFYELTLE